MRKRTRHVALQKNSWVSLEDTWDSAVNVCPAQPLASSNTFYFRIQCIAYSFLMSVCSDLLRSITLKRLIVLLLNTRAILLFLNVISGFFSLKAYTRAFIEQNVQSGWKITEIYSFNPEYILVRIITRKRKSEVYVSLLKIPDSARALRRTYKRLHAEDYIDNEAAVLVRAGKKFAAENKILRKRNKGLRGTIFQEKGKKKRGKALNFYKKVSRKGRPYFSALRKLRARTRSYAEKGRTSTQTQYWR